MSASRCPRFRQVLYYSSADQLLHGGSLLRVLGSGFLRLPCDSICPQASGDTVFWRRPSALRSSCYHAQELFDPFVSTPPGTPIQALPRFAPARRLGTASLWPSYCLRPAVFSGLHGNDLDLRCIVVLSELRTEAHQFGPPVTQGL